MGIWTKEGSANLGGIYFRNLSQNPKLYLGLLANNPDDAILNDLSLGDIVEPSASSYARKELTPSNWITTDELNVYPTVEYEIGLEQFGTIYGCFLATSADSSGKLIAIHKFTTPYELKFYGDRLEIDTRVLFT